ncbi:MAG: hypothetical protein GX372_01465 [Ignavibacteria bacterium]|jgi:Skp family chaperone for outer membrane proteins|nr:hypothetical protein [Ignavibacteria bacterium]
MKLKKFVSAISLAAIFTSSVIFTSCSCKITEEQLAQIAEERRQERALNAEITSTQSENSKMTKELQTRQRELDDCNQKRNIVKQRLNQWPNIWPDYTPEP